MMSALNAVPPQGSNFTRNRCLFLCFMMRRNFSRVSKCFDDIVGYTYMKFLCCCWGKKKVNDIRTGSQLNILIQSYHSFVTVQLFFAMCFSHQTPKYGKRTRKFNNVNINHCVFFFFLVFFRVFSKWFRQKWILLGFVSVVLSEQTWLTVDFDNIKFYVSVCDSTRALYTKHNCPVEGQPLWQMKLQLIYRLALLP